MSRSGKKGYFRAAAALSVILLVAAALTSCILDPGDESSAVSGTGVSGTVTASGQEPSGMDPQQPESGISGTGTSQDETYDRILSELDELEKVISGLDDYTSEDFTVPTP